MLQVSDRGIPGGIEMRPAADRRLDPMTGGFVASLVLHGLVMLLVVFGLPWLTQMPPPVQQVVIPVNLVALGDKTASPPSPTVAPLPQEKAREVSKTAPPEAAPVAQTPPPPAVRHKAEDRSTPDQLTATEPAQQPQISKQVKGPKLAAQPTAKLPQQRSPAQDLASRLKQLAQLKQPPAPVPPNPRQQDGAGSSNLTATAADTARAHDATYSVRDFIRAQVERRWNPDRNAVKAGNWRVSIHIVLDPDGSVSRAEIVNERRYRSNSAYFDFALSARNAVLLSSPLAVPPGGYEIAKDIVVDFDPKQVLQ
jgi:outer membrane biosynthesis protein TonB